MKNIAIIDCAIKRPSIHCFNGLIHHFQRPFSFHSAPTLGLSSLKDLDDATEADGYIIFGSASNVEDRLDWQKDLALLMKDKLKADIPVMGICFGHQLMADAFGCEVAHIKPEQGYKGTRMVRMIEDGFGFQKNQQLRLFKYHSYEVTSITDDFIHLGSSDECLYDALALKEFPYFSFQGHPESSRDFFLNEMQPPQWSEEEFVEGQRDGKTIISKFIELVEKS